ncbi:MAG: hypothetical protein NXI31_06985 [bacterium]|nr:hypothetical protein [bacterium]
MDLVLLVKSIAPPAIAALALVSAGGNRLLPLALAIGLTMAFVLLHQWPVLPHVLWSRPGWSGAAVHWLYWCLMVVILTSGLEHWKCLPPKIATFLGPLVGAGAVWFVMRAAAAGEGVGWQVLHVGGGALAVAALVVVHRRLMLRAVSSPFLPAFFVVALAVDVTVLILCRSDSQARVVLGGASALLAAIITSLWRKPFVLSAADASWLGVLHALLLLAAAELAYLPWMVAMLVAVVPVVPLTLPKSFAKERPRRWMLVALLLAALPAAAAIALAW